MLCIHHSINVQLKLKTPTDQDAARGDQGTYNPRSAWMLVDSRRRVLPDIDGNTLVTFLCPLLY